MAETNKGNFSTQGRSGSEYKPDSYGSAVGGTATAIKEKAKDVASTASEMATQAKDKAQEWASTASSKANDVRSNVGEGIESFAGKIRDKAPEQGMLGSAAAGVANTIEAAGSYLRDHDFGEMGQEVTNVIRRYPIQAILVGVGLGFLLARATRS